MKIQVDTEGMFANIAKRKIELKKMLEICPELKEVLQEGSEELAYMEYAMDAYRKMENSCEELLKDEQRQIEQCLQGLEMLEEESYELWGGETSIRQQDIWFEWEQEVRVQLGRIIEEKQEEQEFCAKKFEEFLRKEWNGEAAQLFLQNGQKIYGAGERITQAIREDFQVFSESVENNVKKL